MKGSKGTEALYNSGIPNMSTTKEDYKECLIIIFEGHKPTYPPSPVYPRYVFVILSR